jgi:WD40 repeat protein
MSRLFWARNIEGDANGRAGSRRVVLCGSQDGVLHTYKWGQWADCSDRFPGHPSSIDAIAAFDDDTVMTGSSDGLIRVVTIQPNAFVGVIGDHGEFPVEELVLRWGDDGNSADGAAGQAAPGGGGGGLPPLLASASHDHTVRFWDLSALVDGGESSEDDSDDEDSSDSDSSDSDSSGGGGDSQSRRGGGASQQQGPVAQQAAKRRKVLQREAAAGPAARGRRGGGGGGAKLESAAASDFFSDL